MTLLLSIVIHLINHFLSKANSHQTEEMYYEKIYPPSFSSFNYSSLNSESVLDCLMTCFKQTQCKSFKYLEKQKLCSLYSKFMKNEFQLTYDGSFFLPVCIKFNIFLKVFK